MHFNYYAREIVKGKNKTRRVRTPEMYKFETVAENALIGSVD